LHVGWVCVDTILAQIVAEEQHFLLLKPALVQGNSQLGSTQYVKHSVQLLSSMLFLLNTRMSSW
jgi:hypothetical protein